MRRKIARDIGLFVMGDLTRDMAAQFIGKLLAWNGLDKKANLPATFINDTLDVFGGHVDSLLQFIAECSGVQKFIGTVPSAG